MLGAVVISGSVFARDELSGPAYLANQNPFVQIFGLPQFESGFISPAKKLDVGFLYYVSNNSIDAESGSGDRLIWDGETATYNLRFRYGAFEWLELGLDVPVIDNDGGYLDSLIRHFHDLFSMPNDRQEAFSKNQLHYLYEDNGEIVYENTERKSGLGDIRISAAVPLVGSVEQGRQLSLRSSVKLPTGDAEDLLGSGGTDFSIGTSFSDLTSFDALNLFYSLNLGVIMLGDSDVFHVQQESFAGYGGVNLGWKAFKQLSFKIQLDGHTAMYDSEFKQLGSSLQLSAGGSAMLPGSILLDMGMTQNTTTDATPDLGLYLLVRRLF